MKILRRGSSLDKIIKRNQLVRRKSLEDKVRKILDDVRLRGDEAVLKYAKCFDNVKFLARDLRVPESEISGAFQNITADFINDLKIIFNNVTNFYKRQNGKCCKIRGNDGILLQEIHMPLDSVGIYIPAGTAPLVSTVYMTVILAKVAGVKRIVIASPPDFKGFVNPYILAVANLLNVNEIYKIGGAQAIAALAYGTKTVAKVDKIVGPGNMYVTEAKRQVFGNVDIDMLAGPSELVVVANRMSDPSYVVADMEAQAEHAGGLSILVSTSRELMKKVKLKVPNGFMIYAKTLDEAAAIVNDIAPEHLQIMTNRPKEVLKKIRHAGAIFLGPYSPTALGDYAAGPSHVLPTMGSARFFSGLSVSDFRKKSHIISYSKKALEKMVGPIDKVAMLEGMPKHAESIKIRFQTQS